MRRGAIGADQANYYTKGLFFLLSIFGYFHVLTAMLALHQQKNTAWASQQSLRHDVELWIEVSKGEKDDSTKDAIFF